jgi:hypothetical protein
VNILPPPGPQRRRQLILLVVTLVALAFVLRSYWQPADPAAGAPPTSNSPATPGSAGLALAASQLPEPLKLSELEPVPDAPEAGRNPFRFGVRPPPPAPPPPPVTTAPPPPPLPVGPPPVPPIPLELVGLHTLPEGRVLVTLKDKGGAVFQVFEGQIVDGRYRVVKVGVQSVVVAHLDGTNPRTLAVR